MAVNYEVSVKDARALHGSGSGVTSEQQEGVYRVGEQNQGDRRECFCCGSTQHLANACHMRNMKCFKTGHLKRRCKEAAKRESGVTKPVRNVNCDDGGLFDSAKASKGSSRSQTKRLASWPSQGPKNGDQSGPDRSQTTGYGLF